jgi:hypothetical protein
MHRLLLLVALCGTAAAEPDREVVAKIVGHAYDGKTLEQLGQLSDLGPRLTGTATYQKAAELTASWLREAGATNVHLEKLQMAHGWQRGTARARAAGRTLRIESSGWTPSATVKAPIAIVHDLDAAVIDKAVKGKIVYIDWADRKEGGPQGKQWLAFERGVEAVKANGGLAIVSEGSMANGVLGTGAPAQGGKILGIPMVGIAREDGKWLARQKDPVLELEVKNTITGPIEVVNVVGELRGSSSEWILLGAHLDSWDFATGTQDNGSGVVQVIAAARELAKAGPLVRSVRFALWAGEEEGLNGSHAYVAAHEAELATCAAVLNTDNGAGHVKGWKVEGRKDVKATLDPIAKQLLAPLGAGKVDMQLTADTDHFSFLAEGVPALDLLVDMSGYDTIHHKIADTIDKVDAHDLASGAAVLAVTAYAIASTKEPFAPHLDRAAVVELFKEGGFDELLRYDGWWK